MGKPFTYTYKVAVHACSVRCEVCDTELRPGATAYETAVSYSHRPGDGSEGDGDWALITLTCQQRACRVTAAVHLALRV